MTATQGKTWPCEHCRKPAGTREEPLFGLPDEPKVCRECWYSHVEPSEDA